jgi:Uma2 family endonuclease
MRNFKEAAKLILPPLTRDRFRELYDDHKPNYELIDGVPEPKALGSKRHARLQLILAQMLEELGFRAATELTLAISETWDPVPDVAGTLGPETSDPYQTSPPAVVIEILSPSDRFTLLDKKCRRYAEWGVPDILAFDPVECHVWHWDTSADSLVRVQGSYWLTSLPKAVLSLVEAFRRLEA